MAGPGSNQEAPGNIILEAREKHVPRNPKIGLAFDKHCVFVLLREHDSIKERKGLYFVYDLGYKYGFVQKRKMRHFNPGGDGLKADMCKVIEKQDAETSDQMSLEIGDTVKVLDRSPTGWYYGVCKKGSKEKRGWFSKHFVREKFDFEQSVILTYQFTVQAQSSFESSNTRHLEFSAWEHLDVIQRPNTFDEYWLARNKDGKIGQIPKARVDEKPELRSVLLRFPWYHPGKSRSQTTAFMSNFLAEPNHFLVRDSEKYPGDFTICVTKGDGTHPLTIRARTTLTGYDVDDRPFGSLREIINYYSRQPIFIDNCIDNSHYFLLHVIQREDWRDS